MSDYRILPDTYWPPFTLNGEPSPVALGPITATIILDSSATNQDKQRIIVAAAAIGLQCSQGVAPHSLTITGSPIAIQEAFQVYLYSTQLGGETFRTGTGSISVPVSFGTKVVDVLGLDTRPAASPRWNAMSQPSSFAGYLAKEVAAAYGAFPANKGKGRSVGIIELGGRYEADSMAWYWAQSGLSGSPNVQTTGPQTNDSNATVEVMLDVEIIASLVPLALTKIYFGPNSFDGFYNAIAAAIHDHCDAVSISWGCTEDKVPPATLKAYEQLAATAGPVGTTITAASGDRGTSDGYSGLHVDFPASAPHILGCGGTHLVTAGGAYGSESVWNNNNGWATGGGYSNAFLKMGYQKSILPSNPHRMVPDVASDADPYTGFKVRTSGTTLVVGGTSAASPLWAALICRLNKARGARLGFVHPKLYGLPRTTMRQVLNGNCGAYAGRRGYSLCCGLGTPPANFWTTLP